MLNTKAKSFGLPAAERVSILILGFGAAMLALGLVIQYYRLVH